MKGASTVHLGYEVGTGQPVEIPLAHTFVSGQTQQSGKTTTLRAIVDRSGARALAFVTKRGEDFEGRTIRPYLPRDGESPIHWRQVETILASALEQRNLKWERMQIINAAKGARSLDDVQANVRRLAGKIKGDHSKAKEIYTLLDEYLELVLPQMRSLNASHTLDLQPGLSVMDLTGIAGQTQAMVIRAALERINHHESGVLTVLPEAWEFAPRGRSAPAKDEAVAMARKGAAPNVKNFLLVDSQDIAGVEPVVRQACSVWLLGVQRELNEVKRALAMMKQAGIATPKAADVAQLELGQFFACWGRHALKVYVQPSWMNAAQAKQVADGSLDVAIAAKLSPPVGTHTIRVKEVQVNAAEAQALRDENARLVRENGDLRARIERLEAATARDDRGRTPARAADRQPAAARDRQTDLAAAPGVPTAAAAGEALNGNEALYQQLLGRLVGDAARDPVLLRILTTRPELEVNVKRQLLEIDGTTLRGRLARLLSEGFFDDARSPGAAIAELLRRGAGTDVKFNVGKELQALTNMGFLLRSGKTSDSKYEAVPGMKVNIVEEA